MTNMILDSEQVNNIATSIESDNKKLKELLDDSKTEIDKLATYWEGDASDATRAAYDAFATKYFQVYYDVLNQYVTFLRTNVADQYESTEKTNVSLAEQFN